MPPEIIFSDPAVTKTAKDFLKNPTGSARYKEAAHKAVAEVVTAIVERMDREMEEMNINHEIKVQLVSPET